MQHARRAQGALALALALLVAATFTDSAIAAPKRGAAGTPAAVRTSDRQFTGTLVAVDAASLTVERGGRAPKQMVFSRTTRTRSTGDLAKDARVTVYWRDEAGKPVAHRVVVKTTATSEASH